jgi:hypothetical protein
MLNRLGLIDVAVMVGGAAMDTASPLLHRWVGTRLICVDPVPSRLTAARLAPFGQRCETWTMVSEEATPHVGDQSVGFVMLSSDCADEIPIWAPKLRSDGVLAGDGYEQPAVRNAVLGHLADLGRTAQRLPGRGTQSYWVAMPAGASAATVSGH